MKRLFVLFFMLYSISAFCQQPYQMLSGECFDSVKPTKGKHRKLSSMKCLKGEEFINFSYCFDDAVMDRKPLRESHFEFYSENVSSSIQEINLRMYNRVNEDVRRHKNCPRLSNHAKARYTLKLHVIDVDSDGEQALFAILFDNETCEILSQDKFKADGGHRGTLANLIGDGAEDIAENIAWDLGRACR